MVRAVAVAPAFLVDSLVDAPGQTRLFAQSSGLYIAVQQYFLAAVWPKQPLTRFANKPGTLHA
jgi:hypothetical protein